MESCMLPDADSVHQDTAVWNLGCHLIKAMPNCFFWRTVVRETVDDSCLPCKCQCCMANRAAECHMTDSMFHVNIDLDNFQVVANILNSKKWKPKHKSFLPVRMICKVPQDLLELPYF